MVVSDGLASPLTELPLAESMICTLPMASHDWQHKLCICSQCYRSACLGQGCRPALLCRLVQFVADPAVSRSGLLLAVHSASPVCTCPQPS